MHLRETIRPPAFKDKVVEVRILSAILVAGVAREVGSTLSMPLFDALGLRNSIPPSVEILS